MSFKQEREREMTLQVSNCKIMHYNLRDWVWRGLCQGPLADKNNPLLLAPFESLNIDQNSQIYRNRMDQISESDTISAGFHFVVIIRMLYD